MLSLAISLILFVLCDSRSIGTVNKTRFTNVNQLNTDTLWIENQISSKQCLCTVLSQYNNVLLFNSYSNGSCQLFFSFSSTYTMESNINSTLILLSPLPPISSAPCCANLTWLMARIRNSTLSSIQVNNPSYLVIDDLGYLAVLSSNSKLVRYNRTTMSLISSTTLNNPKSLSYYNKRYYITQGSSSSSTLNIYSTANLSNITTLSIQYDPRDYAFIRNGTVMAVTIKTLNKVEFYNATSPTSYTLTSTLSVADDPNTLYSVNDTLIYLTTYNIADPLYALTYNSTTNSWMYESMPITKSFSLSRNFQPIMDICGRLWVSVDNYGIRIFDTDGTKSLYNWTLGDKLNGIVLTKNFELYVADYDNDEILSYRPNIEQCTS